jgi:hypothetical protein
MVEQRPRRQGEVFDAVAIADLLTLFGERSDAHEVRGPVWEQG